MNKSELNLLNNKRSFRRLGVCALSACLWLLSTLPAAASPVTAFGLDAESASQAMAVTASAKPLSAAATNPARLMDARGGEAALGIVVSEDQITINRKDAGLDTYVGWQVGLATPIPLGQIRDRIYAGFNLHVPYNGLYDVNNTAVADPVVWNNGSTARRLAMDAAFAVRLWERIAIGFGLHLMPLVTASVNIDFRGQNESSSSDVKVGYGLIPKLGFYAEPIQGLHLGFSYHAGMKLALNVPAEINISDAIGNIHVRLKGYAYTEPHTFTIGARYDFSRHAQSHLANFALDLDFAYRHYTDPIASSANVQLLDDDGGIMNETNRPYQEFNGSWSLRTALTWMPIDEISASVGYAFEKSAIPAQRNAFNVLDSDRNRIAFGASFWLPEPWLGSFGLGFSTAAQFDIYAERNMEKYEFLVGNPGFPSIHFEGYAFAWHGSILMRFE